MKRFLLAGGFVGFLLTFATRIGSGAVLNSALRDGMIGCLILAFVAKIFYRQLENAAVSVIEREIAAAEKEEGEEKND